MKIIKPTKDNLNKTIEFINKGGVVVCPTDTVYGFLADAGNKKAVEKIFKIKKRPKDKPLPIFVADLKMAKQIAEIDSDPAFAEASAGKQEKILKKYWPGKFTFILKLKQKNKKDQIGQFHRIVPMAIAENKTIALRLPKYKFLNDLLKKNGEPLAQTSVNISGQPPLAKISEIIEQFGKNKLIGLIIDAGNLPKSNPSKIIDLTENKNKILRK
jgi:L-threonylcarbamoyladenylate synthase